MLVTNTSALSGKVNTMDIPVTIQQLQDWKDGALIQDAMPNLTPEQREFILSGITPEEWAAAFDGDGD